MSALTVPKQFEKATIPLEIQESNDFVGSTPEDTLRNIADVVMVLNSISSLGAECSRGTRLILDSIGCAAAEVAAHLEETRKKIEEWRAEGESLTEVQP